MLNKARCLARDFKLNPARFILEYNELLPAIVASDAAKRFCVASNGVADNRPLWNETVLSEAWREATFPSRPAPFVEVVPMVRIWNSIDHGECQVERDIGEMRAELTEHVGIGDVNLRNILLMRSFGAREAEEICSASGVSTQPTRLWDARWRAVFGTRFGLYSKYPRAAPAKRPASTNTFAAAKRSVLRAAAAATQEVRDGVADATFAPGPGAPRLSDSAHWNAKFEKFNEQTKAKTVAARVAASQRKAGFCVWVAVRRVGPPALSLWRSPRLPWAMLLASCYC